MGDKSIKGKSRILLKDMSTSELKQLRRKIDKIQGKDLGSDYGQFQRKKDAQDNTYSLYDALREIPKSKTKKK